MGRRVEADFDGDPAAVAAARRFVVSALTGWGMGHLADAAQICTSEAASNAVRHARSAFRLVLQADGTDEVMVRIEDRGLGEPVLRTVEPDAEHGRGMWLISSLSARWGWEPMEAGKAVWFTVAQSRRPGPADSAL